MPLEFQPPKDYPPDRWATNSFIISHISKRLLQDIFSASDDGFIMIITPEASYFIRRTRDGTRRRAFRLMATAAIRARAAPFIASFAATVDMMAYLKYGRPWNISELHMRGRRRALQTADVPIHDRFRLYWRFHFRSTTPYHQSSSLISHLLIIQCAAGYLYGRLE